MYGLVAVGLIANVIAMKYYPLTAEKMEEVRSKIQELKMQDSVQVNVADTEGSTQVKAANSVG